MNIVGPDSVVFGVNNVDECAEFLTDYGLKNIGGGVFEALDGTNVVLKDQSDSTLPEPLETGSKIRKTVYGVVDQSALDAIEAELSKDRKVKKSDDGSLEAFDDLGFALGFQITVRREIELAGEVINSPGTSPNRPMNTIGTELTRDHKPRSLSHVVYFVPDAEKMEKFYAERLGFITTDRFVDVGPFMRPAGTNEHHSLFFIETPAHMQGIEHLTFHMAGPSEVMFAGTNMVNKGYQSFWGPGKHVLGSNWFWYFKSPMGCNIEFDADMDLHDDNWVARDATMNSDNSQSFLFQYREKWSPGPD